MERPDPMIAAKPGAEDVQAIASHPQRGLFTGLAQKYQQVSK